LLTPVSAAKMLRVPGGVICCRLASLTATFIGAPMSELETQRTTNNYEV